MSLLDTLSAFFARPAEERADDAPEGVCPNCWGRYEYDGEIRQIARDRQIDVNNGAERYAFIQDFVVTHIEGIRLRNDGRGAICPKCGARSRSAMLGDRPVRRRRV